MTQDYTNTDGTERSGAPIHVALARVMADVPAVAKSERNQQQQFNFRGIDATLNAVGPALRRHGVVLAPHLVDQRSDVVETGKNRTPMRSVTLTVSYTFTGPAGDTFTVTVPGEAMDSGDKAFSKAMSVALRTALLQTLALPTDERDPDSEVHERASRPNTAAQSRGSGNSGGDDGHGHRINPPPDTGQPELNEVKMQVARAGTERDMDIAAITADFEQWSQGEPIGQADTATLRAYLDHLQTTGVSNSA